MLPVGGLVGLGGRLSNALCSNHVGGRVAVCGVAVASLVVRDLEDDGTGSGLLDANRAGGRV